MRRLGVVKAWTLTGLLVAAGCGGSNGARPDGGGAGGIGVGGSGGGTAIARKFTVSLAPQRNVDILFLIDDSFAMSAAQATLSQGFARFVAALRAAPGGLPDLHVAVVSSDMGAGDGSISGCNASSGDQGVFRYTPRGTCTSSGLQTGATFISDVGGTKNYTGNLEDVLGCISALGQAGCGFPHQFAAILRALGADGSPPPQENQGFLRQDGTLVVVLLTNKDDCSASPGNGPNGRVPLFDTANNRDMASQLGPPARFRCNEFGHTCPTGVSGDFGRTVPHPDRKAPNQDVTATVDYDGCSSDDIEGYLVSARDTANAIKALKTDQSKVFVAAITGSPTPYQVHWKNPSSADMSCGAASCPWPEMTHACTASNGSSADPGVRNSDLVTQFGDNGLMVSICDADFGPALEQLATQIEASITGPCISDPIADDPTRAGYQPQCSAIVHLSNGQGSFTDQAVPPCADNGGAAPCWSLSTDAAGCQQPQITFATAPTAQAAATYECEVCASGVVGQGCSDPGRTGDTVGRSLATFGATCDVGAGVTGGPGGVTMISVAPACASRTCLLPPPEQAASLNTGALCTSSCSTNADCANGMVGSRNDPSDRRCKNGFVCMVPTTVGDFCCEQMCVCRDFVVEPVGGFKTPAVCMSGAAGACPNVH